MGEGTTPSDWRTIDRRHRAGILLGAAVVLAGVAFAVLALDGGEPGQDPGGESTRTLTPAEQTAEATIPVPSYEPTTAPGTGGSGAPGAGSGPSGGAGQAPGTAVTAASTRVLYRRDGWLCVAALDGSGERRVVASDRGVFSLSPDGATVASVDADGVLRLCDVASGGVVGVGPAEQDRPAWSPDSTSLVYTAPGPKVTRVDRAGATSRILLAGRLPVVAPDGVTVVAASPTAQDPAVLVWREGDVERRATGASVTGVACSAARIYIGTAPGSGGTATLRSLPLTGLGERAEARPADSSRGVSIASLLVSPDGARVVYAEQGDDGYSRVYVVPTQGGAPIQISGRRDSYPLQWAGSTDAVLLIEGNPSQGEATSLVSASVTSGVRRLIVEGAGR